MKKLILVFLFVILIYMFISNTTSFLIPEDALRIRIIANSNSEYDQKVKKIIKKQIQYKLYNLLKNVKGVKEARKIINDNLNNVNQDIDRTFKNLNYDLDYTVNYGLNYFPSKDYNGITYEEGYYESLVITLGEGKGDNWWCVLFPPLCLIEAEENEDIEYTTVIKEIIKSS